jgi:monoamine oxidase
MRPGLSRRLTRRRFLHLVARAGGVRALYSTMAQIGLLPVPAAYAGPPQLPPASGEGVRVLVLGAGIAGMTAAYELGKAGYACTVLEARQRPGGRNWSIRRGDTVLERDAVQTCSFDAGPHMYFNAGPARIPHHHTAILGYCREFGVPLEVMVNDNRATYLQDDEAFEGKPVSQRRVVHDGRGFIAELLAKAVDQDALADVVSAEDKERMLAFVRSFGALGADNRYQGSPRSGYRRAPGAGLSRGQLNEPLAFRELLKSEVWRHMLYNSERFEQAATMLQPVGGMDRIAHAFAERLGQAITYGSAVVALNKTDAGIRAIARDALGKEFAIEADYALCTIPLSVLAAIASDLSPAHKSAMADCHYVKAVKLAFQADRRFWEEDHQIYGGISWTTRDITQIWYPSAGFQAQKGILIGGYIWSDAVGEAFGRMTPQQRLEAALISGAKLHAQYRQEVSRGIAVCWGNVPYSSGAWADWSTEARETAYAVLNEPDGPIHFAGEHMSYLTGWQEGAVLSAHHAVRAIAERVKARKG